MSQDQQPILSRRELRRARAERLEDQPQDRTLGQDRPLGQQDESGQREDRRPEAASRPGLDSQPASGAGTAPAAEAGIPVRPRQRRSAAPPSDEAPAAVAERSSQIRARDRAALRAIKELEDKEEQLAGGGRPTRRQLRLQQLKEEVAPSTSMIPVLNGKPRVTAGPGSSKAPAAAAKNPVPQAQNNAAGVQGAAGGMSVEQALAARELIAAQAQSQLAKMEHIADEDPEAVDPDVLAEQIALAERAAVLNKRALAKQKLAEQNVRPAPAKTDPTAANNLAMVTPLEFVKVPGVDRPVMKPPTTSFVPVATPSPKQPAPGKSSGRAGRAGRRGILARAEAAARAATGNRGAARPDPVPTVDPVPTAAFAAVSASEQAEPPRVAARSAYGLEPLDAATAGLGRAKRSRLLQLGVLALGITALIAGIIMIISGLTR